MKKKSQKSLSVIKLYKLSANFFTNTIYKNYGQSEIATKVRQEAIKDFIDFVAKHKDEV